MGKYQIHFKIFKETSVFIYLLEDGIIKRIICLSGKHNIEKYKKYRKSHGLLCESDDKGIFDTFLVLEAL